MKLTAIVDNLINKYGVFLTISKLLICIPHEGMLQLWRYFVTIKLVGHLTLCLFTNHFPAGKPSVVDSPQANSPGRESSREDILHWQELDPFGLLV